MLKEKRQIFEFMFMACDLFVVSCAWLLAYWLRFEVELIPAEKGVPPVTNYVSMLLFIWPIWAFVFRRTGLYRPMRGIRRRSEVLQLINANALSVLLLIAVTYLFREKDVPFSRLVFGYFGALAIVLTLVERALLRFGLREVRRKGYNLRYLLVVGSGRLAGEVINRIRHHRELGIQLVGCLTKDGSERRGPGGVPVIGAYKDLAPLMDRINVDQIVVALPWEDQQVLPELMQQIGDALVDVRIVPDIHQFVQIGGSIEEFEGLPVISLQTTPLEGIHLLTKRGLDVVLGSVLLVLFAPLMALLALLVKLTSRGPVFYRQERVSVDGTHFSILKFRTMSADAENNGPGWTVKGDSRVTPLGKFMRSTSLDELPQLFNVLKGEMSLVGPRPERPVFIQEFRRRVPRYMLRHKVPAGMTGWAQVHGWRGDTSIDKRIELDLYYIENWSILLDFKILVMTLFRGFRNHNAC